MNSPPGTDNKEGTRGSESTILRIVAGKGGVGRTTVTAALAENASAAGKRVLAVDATETGGLEQLLRRPRKAGRNRPPEAKQYRPPEAEQFRPPEAEQYEVLRLTTRSSLDEYLKIHLRLPLGPSRLGPLAKIFDYVSAAAPGVRELLIIGKVGWEVRHGDWDEVIVDAPATGHVVELLSAPRAMAELIPTGPLAQQTSWLGDVLAATTTSVVLVTIPEELPVTETGELYARLTAETQTPVAGVIVNKAPPVLTEAGILEAKQLASTGSALGASAALVSFRSQAATAQFDRLADLGLPIVIAGERIGAPVEAVRSAFAGSWLAGP